MKKIDDAIGAASRDLVHRTSGLIARAESLVTHDHAHDSVLAARVRAKLGRIVSHPHAIEVIARNGHVVLSGPVLAREVDRLLAAIETIRGVTDMENCLEIHEQPGKHPRLQERIAHNGGRPEFPQRTWSPTMRLLLGMGIGAMMMMRLTRRGGAAVLALGGFGAGMVARGLIEDWEQRARRPAARRAWRQTARNAGLTVATEAPIDDGDDFLPLSEPVSVEFDL